MNFDAMMANKATVFDAFGGQFSDRSRRIGNSGMVVSKIRTILVERHVIVVDVEKVSPHDLRIIMLLRFSR